MAAVRAVERGLALDRLAGLSERGLGFTEIAEIVIAPRTVKHRRSRSEPLSPQESDRVLRVERILSQAEAVFGSRARALQWLRRSDDRLGGRSRLSLLKTESGGRLVEEMLLQIAEGIYT
ncbi:MAG: antitoxin Xre/MbcA/ParS toxin-binding domain-containing protein [Terriglobales bacterium]